MPALRDTMGTLTASGSSIFTVPDRQTERQTDRVGKAVKGKEGRKAVTDLPEQLSL